MTQTLVHPVDLWHSTTRTQKAAWLRDAGYSEDQILCLTEFGWHQLVDTTKKILEMTQPSGRVAQRAERRSHVGSSPTSAATMRASSAVERSPVKGKVLGSNPRLAGYPVSRDQRKEGKRCRLK